MLNDRGYRIKAAVKGRPFFVLLACSRDRKSDEYALASLYELLYQYDLLH